MFDVISLDLLLIVPVIIASPITWSFAVGFSVPTPTEPPAPTINCVSKLELLTANNEELSSLDIEKYWLLESDSSKLKDPDSLLYALIKVSKVTPAPVETKIEPVTSRFALGDMVPIPSLVVDGLNTNLLEEIPAREVVAVPVKNEINCSWLVVFSVGTIPLVGRLSKLDPSPSKEVAVTTPVMFAPFKPSIW